MPACLVDLAKSLEELMRKSPLSKMWTFYSDNNGTLVSTFLFANHEAMGRAKMLEIAEACNFLKPGEFEEKFPNVLYIIVNANYGQVSAMPANDRTYAADGPCLLMPGLESMLDRIFMELCFGANSSYVPEDDKYSGELLLKVAFSLDDAGSKIRSEVLHLGGLPVPGLQVKVGDTVLEAFRNLEGYVLAHST